MIELNHSQLKCSSQVPVEVYDRNEIVGDYLTDIILEKSINLGVLGGYIFLMSVR